MQLDVISAILRDSLNDLNCCKVCHQRKYFDQGGLSREREFGPGAFCPRRKCGAERFQERHAIRLTCFLGTAHLRFQRRKLVDNCSSSELTWCYWPLPGCHGISSSLQVSVDVTLKISRNIVENIVENIRLSVSDLLGRGTDLLSGRRCARDYRGGLGLTWTAVRQVPLVEEPPRSRCLLLTSTRFCVTRHGKIFRIFTDIF